MTATGWQRPNFLFIYCDQLRPDALGSLGALPPLRTPAMDRLAAGGVRFASAYTPNPVCVPAREAVITGRWGHRFDCLENGGQRPDLGCPTFPRVLHEAGYATFAAGKQHFRPVREHRGYGRMLLSEGQPAYRQDDDYLLFLKTGGYGHVTQPSGPRGIDYYHPRPSPLPEALHMTAWNTQACVDFIRANRNRPFFCYAGYWKPHPPFDPPQRYWDRYPPESVSLPQAPAAEREPLDQYLIVQNHSKTMLDPDEARIRAVRSAYYALVEQIDDGVARLVETLQACGLLDNTVVVISADHGELLGDHFVWGKRSFYEPAAGVPLLVSWPAGLPAGQVRDAPVSTIDLFPTFCAMAGVTAPDGLDGVNLLPYARGAEPPERDGVGAEYGSGRALKLMWRWNDGLRRWKYVWLVNGGREQLFDLAADPAEHENLASSQPAVAAHAHDRLVAWCQATEFTAALGSDGRLARMPFEPIPFGQVRGQPPAWPARDPDFTPSSTSPNA